MISRRQFLKVAGIGALALAANPLDLLLSSCTSGRGNEYNRALLAAAEKVFGQLENNTVLLPDEQIVVPILDAPLIGIASADNPLFETFSQEEVIGSQWRAPKMWMPEAKSVIVFFFPVSSAIRSRHRAAQTPTNEAWNYGYGKHGQVVNAFIDGVTAELENQGVHYFIPSRDRNFKTEQHTVIHGGKEDVHYSTPWSHRHVGFAAGLGTFGVHRHLITKSGCSGVFASMIVDCEMEPTVSDYKDPYDYCLHCGACIARCPAGAISVENLRNLKECRTYAATLRTETDPGFCGKCLVGIPCEFVKPS